LGPLEVLRSGRPVPLGGPRQRAVLALLLLDANRAVSMDRLAEDVWGGQPPQGWVTSVQTYVFHLRRALEPDRSRGGAAGVLVTSGRGYVLRVGQEQLDAARFEDGFIAGRAALEAGRYAEAAQTLRAALGLWRGPVLADLAVTFHLTQPDPDFLYKLALLLAVPAPPGTPGHVIGHAPFMPGTGPYMISQYQPGASFTLVRNPHFRQWSYAAQPAGYPDTIRFDYVADPRRQLSAVTAGRADLVDLLANSQPSRGLGLRYPTRLHSSLKTGTTYVFLNTRQPPFNNVRARQAVIYAIDRAHIMSLFGLAPGEATVTCQILPVDFPGHQPYCPYTAGASNGTWRGPDMAKARRLVKTSRTTKVPVTVWGYSGDAGVGAYLVRLLTGLGYRATLHTVSVSDFYTAASDPGREVQIGLANFGSDFPSPSTFFLSALSCLSARQGPATNNFAGYCNQGVDKLSSRAQATELTDPAAARALWARVDHAVTDQAPWVPVFNSSWTVFVSSRVGNCQVSTSYGPLLDQMWVR
jgi:ABC-type transport system substrate-binding protein